jgi:hypothetical protein
MMSKRCARVAVVAAALALTPSAAFAQSAASGKAAGKVAPALNELLAPRHGAAICFTRSYDAAHMRAHPRQLVRRLSLLVEVEHIKEDNLYRYNFVMRADLRGKKRTLRTTGECGWAYAEKPREGRLIGCSVECDGGGVEIEQKRGTADTLLMHLADVDASGQKTGKAGRIRMAACGDDEETNAVDLVTGADDRTFRLSKAPLSACRGEARR